MKRRAEEGRQAWTMTNSRKAARGKKWVRMVEKLIGSKDMMMFFQMT